MEAISSLAASQARYAAEAGQIALQSAAESEQRVAQMVAQQAEQVQPSSQSASTNPDHLGQNVDVYV